MDRLSSSMTMQARPFHAASATVMVARHANRPQSGLWRALPMAFAISGGLWALGAGIAIAALHHL